MTMWRFLGALISLSAGLAGLMGTVVLAVADESIEEIGWVLDRKEREEEEFYANYLIEMVNIYENLVWENKDIIKEPSIQYHDDCYAELTALEWIKLDKDKILILDNKQEIQSDFSIWRYFFGGTFNIISSAFFFK